MRICEKISSLSEARSESSRESVNGRAVYASIWYEQMLTSSKWLFLPAECVLLEDHEFIQLIEDIRDVVIWNPEGLEVTIETTFIAASNAEVEEWISKRVGRVVLWENSYYSFGLYEAEKPIVRVLKGGTPDLPTALAMESISDEPIKSLVADLCLEASYSSYRKAGLMKLLRAPLSPDFVAEIQRLVKDDAELEAEVVRLTR
jgi:hypothetical protein